MNKRTAKAKSKKMRWERKSIASKKRSVSAKSAYALYLESEHWKEFKRRKEAVEPKKCHACGDVKLVQLHHMIYRTPLESALLEDVCWLRKPCHEIFHQRAGTVLKNVKQRKLLSATIRIIQGPRKEVPATPAKPEVVPEPQRDEIVQRKIAETQARHARALAEMCKAKQVVVIAPKSSGVGKPKPASYYLGMKVSYAEQEKYKTANGGWKKSTLKKWGVEWPPLKGWRDKLHRGINPNI